MQTGLVRRATLSAFWPLFFVRLVTDVGLSPLQLVLLGTVMELSILIAEVPTGIVADLYSRKWSVIAAFVLGGPTIIASALVENYWALVFITGLAKEAIDRLDVQRLVDVGLPEDLDEALVIGVIVAVRSSFAAAALLVARRRAVGRGVVGAVAGLLLGVAVGVVVLAQVELLAIAALGLTLQGGLHLATVPLVTTWANHFAPSSARATVHSFIGQAEAFGEILGGIALGAVAEIFTVPTAMTLSAALFVIAALRMVLGFILLLAGAAMMVLPGPGLVVIAAGLVILSRDVAWADRALRYVRKRAPGLEEEGPIPKSTIVVSVMLMVAAGAAAFWWFNGGEEWFFDLF